MRFSRIYLHWHFVKQSIRDHIYSGSSKKHKKQKEMLHAEGILWAQEMHHPPISEEHTFPSSELHYLNINGTFPTPLF